MSIEQLLHRALFFVISGNSSHIARNHLIAEKVLGIQTVNYLGQLMGNLGLQEKKSSYLCIQG